MNIHQTPLKLNSRNSSAPQNKKSAEPYALIKNQPQKQDVKFTGLEEIGVNFLRSLQTNQAWGANLVDFSFMVTPRTLVDFTRGPEAGTETMRREASGTVNHSLVGAYGLLAATLLAGNLNSKYNLKANKLSISNDLLNIFGESLYKQINKTPDKPIQQEQVVKSFFKDIFNRVEGFNSDLNKDTGYVKPDIHTQNKIIETLENDLFNKKLSSLDSNSLEFASNEFVKSTGAQQQVRIVAEEAKSKGKLIESVSSIQDLIQDAYKTAASYMKKEVAQTFENGTNIHTNKFLTDLKRFNSKTSLLGLGLGVLVGVCIQPFNMYLTKKKTGKDGFVGVEGREPDKSTGFKFMKIAAGGAFAAGALRLIGKPSELLKNIQFRGFNPTLNQFKLVYGLTIMSRLFAARDKNELREAGIKDTLGFLNWLILGNFVSLLTAAGLQKRLGSNTLIYQTNTPKSTNMLERVINSFKWLANAKVKTRDEILLNELKNLGIETAKDAKSLKFKELLKLLPKSSIAKKQIKYLNLAQLAGYVYSGLVLGMGIPKLNIAITNKVEGKKNKAPAKKVEAETATKTESEKAINNKFLKDKIEDSKFAHFAGR